MRFFTAAAFAVASFASFVVAQRPNPISFPSAGDKIEAGKPITIKWSPTTDSKITLKLRSGDADNLKTDSTIALDITNSGEFTWTPDEDLKAGEDYTIEISSKEGENYSPRFNLESDGAGVTETGTSTTLITRTSSVTSTEATSTETETETETATTSTTATETDEPTTTTSTRRPTRTADEDEEDEDIPNTNADSAGFKAASPLALVFCVAMAVAYLN